MRIHPETLPKDAPAIFGLCIDMVDETDKTSVKPKFGQLSNFLTGMSASPATTTESQFENVPSTSWSIVELGRLEGLYDLSYEIINDIREVYYEASKEDWDGYDAEPISEETLIEAKKFARMLPPSLPLPEIVPEPDGSIGFEWYRQKGYVFVVSVAGNNVITYAGLFGKNREIHGKDEFDSAVPKIIINLVKQLFE